MTDGIIELDSDAARTLGFTSDRWRGGPYPSYLWRDGDEIKLSAVFAVEPGKGALRDLIRTIDSLGLKVAVPTPLAQMEKILRHYGFAPTWQLAEMPNGRHEEVEVWRRP